MKEMLREADIVKPVNFCQKPSEKYLETLEGCDDDPRSVVGYYAINNAGSHAEKGWVPTWDARDLRTNYPDGLKKNQS